MEHIQNNGVIHWVSHTHSTTNTTPGRIFSIMEWRGEDHVDVFSSPELMKKYVFQESGRVYDTVHVYNIKSPWLIITSNPHILSTQEHRLSERWFLVLQASRLDFRIKLEKTQSYIDFILVSIPNNDDKKTTRYLWIKDIYVENKFRDKWIGTELWGIAEYIAKDHNCDFIT